MKTFYVASKFQNFLAVRAMVDALIALGFQNTHDWTRTDEFNAQGEQAKMELTPAEAREHAEADLLGACYADFIVLLPFENMLGALLEVGMGLANNRQIFIIGPIRYTVFWDLPNVHRMETADEFFEALRRLQALPLTATTLPKVR
jgi:hypothetical protein